MKIKLIILSIAALCLSATPVMADLVTYEMNFATLNFTQGTGVFLVQDSDYSTLYLELDDPGGNALDNVAITNSFPATPDLFRLVLDLDMVDEAGVDNWSASGTLKFTDTVTGTNAVEATVTSTSITADGTSLQIAGLLGDLNPPSILVNRGDPWVFVGTYDIGGLDADGTANQITVFNPESYDNGTILTLKFGMTDSLDTFFWDDQSLTGGEVKGTIVPVPAAVLLGLLGLGVAGWKLRKYA